MYGPATRERESAFSPRRTFRVVFVHCFSQFYLHKIYSSCLRNVKFANSYTHCMAVWIRLCEQRVASKERKGMKEKQKKNHAKKNQIRNPWRDRREK